MSAEVPEYAGCVWPMDPATKTEEWAAFSVEVRERSLRLASSTLEALVANRVGNCPVKVRPCSQQSATDCLRVSGDFGNGMFPINWAGAWVNACGHTIGCGCTTRAEVLLPPPVTRVYEVLVDGLVIDPQAYRVDNAAILVRTDGGVWPIRQDLTRPDTEPGTFSVSYLNTYPVDSNGAYAVGLLALEFAKAATNSGKCRLPSGVQSIARQGVTLTIAPGSFPEGNTGIREVDAYVMLWNPQHRRQATLIWSPDVPLSRRTGVPAGPPVIVNDGGDPSIMDGGEI